MADILVDVCADNLRAALLADLRAAGLDASEARPAGRGGLLVVVAEAPATRAGVAALVEELAAAWRSAPAVALIACDGVGYSRAEALRAGADELAAWPREREEFAAKVEALARRRRADVDVHPLTGLPGGAALQRELLRRLPRRGQLALLAFDLRHFKAFNDRYGFLRGDEVLSFMAGMLEEVATREESVYHLGGDDFFIITTPAQADATARAALGRFEAAAGGFHDEADRREGFITTRGRETGAPVRFPLISLTVVCATNEAGDMTHPGRFAQVLAELKEYARRAAGSRYARDRRRVHDTAASLRLRADDEGGASAPNANEQRGRGEGSCEHE